MIVWLNGTHGAGKTTTSSLVQQLIPDSRVFDAEKVGETLMDITPGLPETDNFQHWPPWRQLVVETARRVLDYTGGTLVIPMTVLVEQYWREISTGLAQHAIPVRHFVIHADQDTLRRRIEGEHPVPSPFRLKYLEPYAEAARTWLHAEAKVVDTTHLTPAQAAMQIVLRATGEAQGPNLSLGIGLSGCRRVWCLLAAEARTTGPPFPTGPAGQADAGRRSPAGRGRRARGSP
ncbi:hypothetical protein JOD64_003291 [Micromonospora luteifusca]|uniref:ATP-binding protein n=1 Tax=Micromonospora luteifusca TaxID=709860 RepID=A0ABS2LVZ0_9ACTN|nr:AAA family ATPase [Micromonospora luteifusca]MBM7492069.1 hypothetical protein [Micromonospora luteifusca]